MAFKIAPSKCSLYAVMFIVDGDLKTQQRDIPQANRVNVEFSPGKAHYLGDFVMHAGTTVETNYTMPHESIIRTHWKLDDFSDDYQSTTLEMQRLYPNLANVPTEKRLLVETYAPPPLPSP